MYRTAVVILFHQKRVLIVQRGSTASWMPNKWSLVGGIVDDGEDVEQAAMREVYEETGISVKRLKPYQTIEDDEDGAMYFFTAQSPTMDVKIDWENQDYAWISKDEINKYEYVPYTQSILTRVM